MARKKAPAVPVPAKRKNAKKVVVAKQGRDSSSDLSLDSSATDSTSSRRVRRQKKQKIGLLTHHWDLLDGLQCADEHRWFQEAPTYFQGYKGLGVNISP